MIKYPMNELRSINFKYAEVIVDAISDCFRISKQQLLQDTQIDINQLSRSSCPIKHPSFQKLCQNIIDYSNVQHPGIILGQKLNICLLNELGLVLISSQDLWDSLKFVADRINQHISSFKLDARVINDEGVIRIPIFPESQPIESFLIELCFSYVANLLQYLKIPNRDRIQYHFKHPMDLSLLAEYGITNVTVGGQSKMVFSQECMHVASPLADAHTLQSAQQLCENKNFVSQQSPNIQDKIRKVLNESDNQLPTLDAVAEQLFSTPWTISRKLKKEGTSFQTLVDEIRINRASHLLLNSDLKISDIAQQLGYSDVSSFRRAFKRWFGISPRLFRNQEPVRPMLPSLIASN